MRHLTEDDFSMVYMDTRNRGGDGADEWPKIVVWAADSPIDYGSMQVSILVLQRMMSEDDDWEYIATVNLNEPIPEDDAEVSTARGDRFSDDASITLEAEWCFEDALEAAEELIDELVSKYA